MSSVNDNFKAGRHKLPEPGIPLQSPSPTLSVYEPPIDFHQGVIEAIPDFKEFQGYLAPAQEAFSLAFEGLKSIRAAYNAAGKNQAWNQYQKLLNVAALAERLHTRMTSKFDAAIKNLTAAANALDQSLSQPLEQQAGAGTINAEIREYVSKLDTEARMTFMKDAIKNRNSKVLIAILGAPSFLSGMPEELHSSYTRMYWESVSLEAVRRLTATRKAIELMEKRAPRVHVHVELAMGGKWSTVQALRKSNSEAEKALLMEKDAAA